MINKGDRVIIIGGAEEEKYKGCVFEVLSEPYTVCGSTVVKMKCDETGKYFGGGYNVEFLRKVNEDERRNERDRLIELLHEAFIISDDNYGMPIAKQVADYLMQNGVLVMPVKVGQTVYYIFDGFIEPCTVEVIFLSDYEDKDGNCTCMADIHFDRDDCPYTVAEIYFTDIGKTVFLTKEEAEKALKGGAE